MITVQDILLEAVRVGFELAHITVEIETCHLERITVGSIGWRDGGQGDRGAGARALTEKCGNILLERLALVVQARNSTFVLGLEQRPTPPLTWRVRTVTSGGVGWGGFVHKHQ